MKRSWGLALLTGLVVAATVHAQAPNAASPARFRWQAGQVHRYKVEQVTIAAETIDGKETSTSTKLNLVKRWEVQGTDASGVTTLKMSLESLRLETKKPDGDSIVFDSAKPDPMQPELNTEMGRYVGQPLALLRMDAQGRVIDVKESKFGPASRFESELPFRLTLPDAAPAVGQTWERAYKIKLDPPQGTGESYDATQKYTCKQLSGVLAVIAMTTELKVPPQTAGEQLPLLPLQLEGDVYFNLQAGKLHAVRLKLEKELKDHSGEGSKYVFKSVYSEDVIEQP
jgi:hypothetical protein